MIFDLPAGATLPCNRLAIRIQPDEGISLAFQTKVPGAGMQLRESSLEFTYEVGFASTRIPEAYERLLLDAIEGDATLFTRHDEIEHCWRIVDPIIDGWTASGRPIPTYRRGSWGPAEADALLAEEGRCWTCTMAEPTA